MLCSHEAAAAPMIVGQRIRRPDALDKVKGSALYIEDVAVAGALVAGVLRSPHAHARITRLDVFAARNLPGVQAVLTAADIPGKNLIPDDPERLARPRRGRGPSRGRSGRARGRGGPEALAAGLAAIKVEYEKLPPRLDMERRWPRARSSRSGRSAAARRRWRWRGPDLVVVEGTYHTPYQEHAYIETNGMVAIPEGPGVVVHGLHAVPVLRAEGGGFRARLPPQPRAYRADGDGRRLRWQGRRPLRARRAGRAPGTRHRTARPPHHHPRRGHGR
jgi:CO/xanthine dehydrogenase Mo-binding subunit